MSDEPRRTLVRSVTKPSVKLPPHGPGMKIGLLGGSFNPPHDAHRAISLYAMKRLQLDRVWWLVTPGNPLFIRPGDLAFCLIDNWNGRTLRLQELVIYKSMPTDMFVP